MREEKGGTDEEREEEREEKEVDYRCKYQWHYCQQPVVSYRPNLACPVDRMYSRDLKLLVACLSNKCTDAQYRFNILLFTTRVRSCLSPSQLSATIV